MKYSIQSIEYFDDYEKANSAFEDIKKHNFSDINIGKENEEKTLVKLIENDHELEERTGCVVLKELDTVEEKILKEPIIELTK